MKKDTKTFNKLLVNKFISYGLHLGSPKSFWVSENKPYLSGIRNNFCIFDTNFTFLYLRRSIKYLLKIIAGRKKILFLGAPSGAEKEFSSLCIKFRHYYVEKWVHGFFTNYQKNLIQKYTSLPIIDVQPALIFIFDLRKNKLALQEAARLEIPVMAFVNSDESPNGIDYPIPANINSWKGGLFVVNFFCHLFTLQSSRLFKPHGTKIFKIKK